MAAKQCYWGVLCIGCSELHPVALASDDDSEPPPQVERFMLMCPTTFDDILFERADLLKYFGPSDDTFQQHQLFPKSRIARDRESP